MKKEGKYEEGYWSTMKFPCEFLKQWSWRKLCRTLGIYYRKLPEYYAQGLIAGSQLLNTVQWHQ